MTQVTMPSALGGDGFSYSDDGLGDRDMLGGGAASWFVPMLTQLLLMASSAKNSSASAITASGNYATYSGSLTPASGSIGPFTIATGKSFAVGQWVVVFDPSAPTARFFTGPVTAYNSGNGSMTVNAVFYEGSAGSNWAIKPSSFLPVDKIGYATKTGNYTVVAADRAFIIRYVNNSVVTFNLPAVSGLSDGWWCIIKNDGTENYITLDPNASELIDGYLTIRLFSGEMRMILFNGVGFVSTVIQPFFHKVITTGAGNTSAIPPGYSSFYGYAFGAGGGGGGGCQGTGGATDYYGGGAGGGGAFSSGPITSPSTHIAWTVGVGGTRGVGTSGAGTNAGHGGGTTISDSAGTVFVFAGGGAGGFGSGVGSSSQDSGGGGGVLSNATTFAGGEPKRIATQRAPQGFGGGNSATVISTSVEVGSSVRGGGGGGGVKTWNESTPKLADGGGSSHGGGGGGGGAGANASSAGTRGQGGTSGQSNGGSDNTSPHPRHGGRGGNGSVTTPEAARDGGAPSGGGGGGGSSYSGSNGGNGGIGARGEVWIRGIT